MMRTGKMLLMGLILSLPFPSTFGDQYMLTTEPKGSIPSKLASQGEFPLSFLSTQKANSLPQSNETPAAGTDLGVQTSAQPKEVADHSTDTSTSVTKKKVVSWDPSFVTEKHETTDGDEPVTFTHYWRHGVSDEKENNETVAGTASQKDSQFLTYEHSVVDESEITSNAEGRNRDNQLFTNDPARVVGRNETAEEDLTKFIQSSRNESNETADDSSFTSQSSEMNATETHFLTDETLPSSQSTDTADTEIPVNGIHFTANEPSAITTLLGTVMLESSNPEIPSQQPTPARQTTESRFAEESENNITDSEQTMYPSVRVTNKKSSTIMQDEPTESYGSIHAVVAIVICLVIIGCLFTLVPILKRRIYYLAQQKDENVESRDDQTERYTKRQSNAGNEMMNMKPIHNEKDGEDSA